MKKPKGPTIPPCCDGKWRAINDLAVEAIVIRHHQKMGISVVPWIDERNALTVWVETSFFLFIVAQFGERGVHTNDLVTIS